MGNLPPARHAPRSCRILFLSTVHPHPWNPTKGTFNRSMLQHLANLMSVRAIVPVPWTEQRNAKVEIPDPGYPANFERFWFLPRIAPLALAPSMRLSLASGLKKINPVPDVVLGYWTDPDGTVAADWAEKIGKPLALIVGGSDINDLANSPRRGKRIDNTLGRADLVFGIGPQIRDSLAQRGVPEDRLRVMTRGVDTSLFRPMNRAKARTNLAMTSEKPLLLWIGRMVPVKGLSTLLQALNNPLLKALDPTLALVGDGPLKAQLEQQAEQLGVAENIKFVGKVAHEDLPSWYAASDLVVLPSLSEGVPNVLMEALACGRPFVASDVGSIATIAPDHGRELVVPNDPEALARTIVERLQTKTDTSALSSLISSSAESAETLAKELGELAQAPSLR